VRSSSFLSSTLWGIQLTPTLSIELRLGAGGAITHLSDPEKEWEEVLTKIDAVLGTRKS